MEEEKLRRERDVVWRGEMKDERHPYTEIVRNRKRGVEVGQDWAHDDDDNDDEARRGDIIFCLGFGGFSCFPKTRID
jgi:hypothetical protein